MSSTILCLFYHKWEVAYIRKNPNPIVPDTDYLCEVKCVRCHTTRLLLGDLVDWHYFTSPGHKGKKASWAIRDVIWPAWEKLEHQEWFDKMKKANSELRFADSLEDDTAMLVESLSDEDTLLSGLSDEDTLLADEDPFLDFERKVRKQA